MTTKMMKMLSNKARDMRSLLKEFAIFLEDKTRMGRRFPTRPSRPSVNFIVNRLIARK